jgi:hypothetical protein
MVSLLIQEKYGGLPESQALNAIKISKKNKTNLSLQKRSIRK